MVVAMKDLMMKDQNTNMSNSFLLDDDSSIHFTIDDISGTMSQIDLNTVKVCDKCACPGPLCIILSPRNAETPL